MCLQNCYFLFDEDFSDGHSQLCIFKAIDSYLERCNISVAWEVNFLLAMLTHVNQCLSVVCRLLRIDLAMAGIDTKVFKKYSTRSASSSKTEVTGVSLTDIIKQSHLGPDFMFS